MYTKALKDIVTVQFGYQHRERNYPSHKSMEGSHAIIQIKDISIEGDLFHNQLSRVTPTGNPRRYLVSEGDVLFLSRGQRGIATSIKSPLKETIASYYFYILRVQKEHALPEYLAWFINQPTTQATLAVCQHGSLLKMVPKSAFEELKINLPPLEIQKTIVKLEQLRQKEEKTMRHLAEARKRLVGGVALQIAKGKITNN